MTSIPNNEKWQSFFELLKGLHELWQINSDAFRNRSLKKNAWLRLLQHYQTIEPNANLDSLKKRISNIRTCFHRELKKVRQSEKVGSLYVPNLWYYEKLSFLKDYAKQLRNANTTQDSVTYEDLLVAKEEVEAEETVSAPQKRRRTAEQHYEERTTILREALEQLKPTPGAHRDEAEIYAEGWATSYRKLTPIQQLYAKKAIDEILFLGQLEKLDSHTVQSQLFQPPTFLSPAESTHATANTVQNDYKYNKLFED